MVYCCVPRCPSGKRIPHNVSFHTFPSNPDMAARWVRNINIFIPNGGTWFPQPGDLVCSKHFLPSDFKHPASSISLKPQSVPTIFEECVSFSGGETSPLAEKLPAKRRRLEPTTSPLIVKVIKPAVEEDDNDDSDLDDTPLTELLRESKKSAAFNSFNSTFLSKSNSPVNSPLYVTSVNSVKESWKLTQNLDLSHLSSSGTASNVKNSSRAAPKQPVLEHDQDDHNDDVICLNTNQSEKTDELNAVKKQKVTTKHQPKKQVPSDLIEIGPSTFLKINPDVIKVTKKITPAGNTVMQFVMNPSLGLDAKNIFQPVTKAQLQSSDKSLNTNSRPSESKATTVNGKQTSGFAVNFSSEAESMVPDTTSNEDGLSQVQDIPLTPAILSTTLPVNHSFGSSWKQKHASAMRQKNRQIHALKAKLDKLLKKVDELETRCIVQERQLDFPSLKKLKAIKKNADKGEPHACFILEQIRGYFGNVPLRWSDTTMTQCSIWCRKAPYAYEYFKKADLFRLPCLGTVKRYMKKHPEITTQIKNRALGSHALNSDDSSSDFDFDEDEDDVPNDEDSNENMPGSVSVPCEVTFSENTFSQEDSQAVTMIVPDSESSEVNFASSEVATNFSLSNMPLPLDKNTSVSKHTESCSDSNDASAPDEMNEPSADNHPSPAVQAEECENDSSMNAESNAMDTSSDNVKTVSESELKGIYLPATAQEGQYTTMNLNGQEIILQPGNIIQLNSGIAGAEGLENQFFVIPAADEQSSGDHQYSVAQPVSFVIQNGDNEEQVIYIAEDTTTDIQEESATTDADSNIQ